MVSARVIKLTLAPILLLSVLASIVSLAISASLEAHWRNVGFPNISYRDRERILLAASVWTVIVSIYALIGAVAFPGSPAFGIVFVLVAFAISFILYLIGASSLTALTDKTNCGNVDWSRCNVTKGLVAISWIETIFVFIILLYTIYLGIKASRSGPVSLKRAALTDA
ncbi:uncharacterized protein JCM6883_002768 [Sporobolomyces salmoneus]|uniref:uncharacterized protein n=1 Tax=Sporobolomyces salmoneus TaxID=183962 RepID=UPI00316C7D3A